ncbi:MULTISPECIES: DUF6660 family protein [Chitinophagaceae]
MRIFAFIFSFYILFLSAVPCCAIDSCRNEMQQTQKHHKHEHDDSCKNCSPFNQCGNCPGFTFTATFFRIGTLQLFTLQYFSGYNQSYHSYYISFFWQPPKIKLTIRSPHTVLST